MRWRLRSETVCFALFGRTFSLGPDQITRVIRSDPALTGQVFCVLLAGAALGARLGFVSQVEYLVVGFLCFEGVIPGPEAIETLETSPEAGGVELLVHSEFKTYLQKERLDALEKELAELRDQQMRNRVDLRTLRAGCAKAGRIAARCIRPVQINCRSGSTRLQIQMWVSRSRFTPSLPSSPGRSTAR